MQSIKNFFDEYLSNFYIPKSLHVSNVFEIIILAVLIYEFIAWVKTTRAFTLLKGIIVLLIFWLLAYIFNFTTILWLGGKIINFAIIALVVIFQPELRKALEQLGQKRFFSKILPFAEKKDKGERFSDKTVNELVKTCFELSKTKTGALIVVEQEILLTEYEKTGIPIDALISSQLLINIFEHNTPLHDGAVIIRGDRIVAATCYLPLSDNMSISKELGTRHRAALGISEVTDTMTLVVSEETGAVSIAIAGELFRNIDADYLKSKLTFLQKKTIDVTRYKLWRKGGSKK
ncbi:MAG TPA: diadenylate cyclase CdaA [Lachnospiraceae bacterium]|jgi:diadenylate cyclase|nr:putative membrane protein [Butyrivibrio sp. CAG:318]HJI30633.1 diadenylate cyclase CdaA [Lachnospiraceae bacterium]